MVMYTIYIYVIRCVYLYIYKKLYKLKGSDVISCYVFFLWVVIRNTYLVVFSSGAKIC